MFENLGAIQPRLYSYSLAGSTVSKQAREGKVGSKKARYTAIHTLMYGIMHDSAYVLYLSFLTELHIAHCGTLMPVYHEEIGATLSICLAYLTLQL